MNRALVFVLAVALLLSGCVQATPAPAAPAAASTKPASTQAPAATTPAKASGGGPVSLTVWIGVVELKPVLDAATTEFQNKYPGAKVEVLAFPLREVEKKLSVGLSTGTGPDIFMLDHYNTPQQVQAKKAVAAPQDVSDFVKKSMQPVFRDAVTFDNQVYGVPLIYGNIMLFYNKQHLKDAGLSGPPTTWAELVDYTQKLAQRDASGNLTRSGISLRLTDEAGAAQKYEVFLRQAGGAVVEKNAEGKWHNGYDNQAGRDALQLFVNLLWKYKVNSPAVKGDFEAFAQGTASMFERDPFVVSYMAKNAPGVDYGVALPPKNKREGTAGYLHSLWVSDTASDKRAAWDWILAATSAKNAEKILLDTGWPTPRADVDLSAVYKQFPGYEMFSQAAAKPGYVFLSPAPVGPSDEIATKFAQAMSAAWRDASLVDNPDGIAKVVAKAAAETDTILKRENLYGK